MHVLGTVNSLALSSLIITHTSSLQCLSQSDLRDPQRGDNPMGNQTQSAPNQQSNEPIFADSSGPFFSLYSEAAEDEDNKMVKGWQEDAKGILIFTGLFSAAVAALVTVTVQDLRPNSQDTSAFYLGNIYEALADPNVTRASSVVKPPPFSPPRYAIWVNSLWFLSLAMSLSCALLATSLQQWARRYIRLTQLARTSPEKRARMREFYANGVEKMHIPWAVEGLPTLLHLSLFLFFGGLAVFLFNVDQEGFKCVVYWIGLFSIVYGLITLLPFIRHDTPYYTPLSKPVWFLKDSMAVLGFYFFCYVLFFIGERERAQRGSEWHYYDWIYQSLEKEAEVSAKKQSSEIDVRILYWTISALGNDNSQEKFFQTIPGLFSSKEVKNLENVPQRLLSDFWKALNGFIHRTITSNSVSKEVESRRVSICMDIASMIPSFVKSYPDIISDDYNPKPVSIDRLQLMTRWFYHESSFVSCAARVRAADMLARMDERDDHWFAFAHEVSGLSKHELRSDPAHAGDNIRLATVIDTCRRASHFSIYKFKMHGFIDEFGKFDIRRTLPRLQQDFCKLWNEFVQEARKPESYRLASNRILHEILRHYISLHQGADASPSFVDAYSPSYPLCNTPSHHPDSPVLIPLSNFSPPTQSGHTPDASPHHSTSGESTVSRRVEETIIAGFPSRPDPTTPSEVGDNSHSPAATDSHTNDASPPGAVATALQDISPVAIASYTLRGTAHSVAAGAASASNPLLPTSYLINLSINAVPPPSHVPPLTSLTGAEPITLPSITTPFHPADDTTLPRLRARGLVNTGSVCFSNAVLQLLVHTPPFWDVFRVLGDLKGMRGPENATPLVDATVRFFEEFMYKGKPSPTQQALQQAVRERLKEDEEENERPDSMDSFEPTYMYDAMKEKSQLKDLLDDKNEDAEEFLRLYLDALDEELVELHTYISPHEPVSAQSVEKHEEGQTAAISFKSPISRIFGGRSRKTVCVPSLPETFTIEAWQSLKLNIQPSSVHTVQDALAQTSQPRSMQVVQSSSNEATQEVLLEVLPQILVLHLERFMYDAATESIDTIRKPIQFGPELEIPLEIMVPAAVKSTKSMHYKLYGVLYHHDESTGGRHYSVDVLHQNGDSSDEEAWFHIDEENVRAVRHEDVFAVQEDERMDNGCVYMLFYCRTALAKR